MSEKKISVTVPVELLGKKFTMRIEYDEVDLKKAAACTEVEPGGRSCIAGWASLETEVE